MDYVADNSDRRLLTGCVYCGGDADTRDHVPARVLLEEPYPENLHAVPSCRACNNDFSTDEQYFACLVEALMIGSCSTDAITRPRIAGALRRSPQLRAAINHAIADGEAGVTTRADTSRVERVRVKLARGHVAYELTARCAAEAAVVAWLPYSALDPDAKEAFDSPVPLDQIEEIGNRASQRAMVVALTLLGSGGEPLELSLVLQDWVEVQRLRYRYLVANSRETTIVRMVLGECIAAEVCW